MKSEKELFAFLRQSVSLIETESVPYKRKPGSHSKKAHYVNGRKVDRQVYGCVKRRLKREARNR